MDFYTDSTLLSITEVADFRTEGQEKVMPTTAEHCLLVLVPLIRGVIRHPKQQSYGINYADKEYRYLALNTHTHLPCIVTDCSEILHTSFQQTVDKILRYTTQSKTWEYIMETRNSPNRSS